MRYLLLVCASCGRIGIDPCVPSIELPPPPTGPFGQPVLLVTLSSTDYEDDPTLTGDELEIVFQSGRGAAIRLWHSVRASRTDPWPTPTPLVELDAYEPNTPELSRDGLRMRFSSAIDGNFDLYLTTRPDRASAWGTPVHLAALASPQEDSGAVELLDGHGLVFFSARAGGSAAGDLWEALDNCAGLGPATPLTGEIETPLFKANAWMRDDGLTLVYTTEGSTGAGDLHMATRTEVGGPFGAPIELTSLSSTGVDDDAWLNDAMDTIYFASTRDLDGGLYSAVR